MDVYVSFRKSDGTWTNPKNVGPTINTENDDDVGDISPDGKFLFFTRNDDIYWVNSRFITVLSNTNHDPYVKNSIPDRIIEVKTPFSFSIADSTFYDDDGKNTLEYSSRLSNGDTLPDWLHFDAESIIFSGVPQNRDTFLISIVATDTGRASVSDTFKVTISD